MDRKSDNVVGGEVEFETRQLLLGDKVEGVDIADGGDKEGGPTGRMEGSRAPLLRQPTSSRGEGSLTSHT